MVVDLEHNQLSGPINDNYVIPSLPHLAVIPLHNLKEVSWSNTRGIIVVVLPDVQWLRVHISSDRSFE